MATFHLSVPSYFYMWSMLVSHFMISVRETDCRGLPNALDFGCATCKFNCSHCRTLDKQIHTDAFLKKVLLGLKILTRHPTPSTRKIKKILSIQSEPSGYVYNNKVMQFVIGNTSTVDTIKSFDLSLYFEHKGKKNRMIKLLISAVNERGKEKKKLASLEFRVKTGWKHMSLPINTLRRMLENGNGVFYLFIKCQRCNRRTKVILPFEQKKKKRRRLRRKRIRRLLRMLKTDDKCLNDNRPVLRVTMYDKPT